MVGNFYIVSNFPGKKISSSKLLMKFKIVVKSISKYYLPSTGTFQTEVLAIKRNTFCITKQAVISGRNRPNGKTFYEAFQLTKKVSYRKLTI